MTGDLSVPQETFKDFLHSLATAGLASVPYTGAFCAELFNWIFGPPIQERQREWQRRVAEVLVDLSENRGIDVGKLRDDPAFIDVLTHATRIAITTAEAEKLAALKSAVLNAALDQSVDVSLHQAFLGLVDRFTSAHLQILELFDDPPRWFQAHGKPAPEFFMMSNMERVLAAAYPELANRREFTDLVWSDLHAARLVGSLSLHVSMSAGAALQSATSDIGKQFLEFIREKPKK